MLRKLAWFLLTFFLVKPVLAQPGVDSLNNLIKLNLSALIVKNVSLQYERKAGPRISVAVGVHILPFGNLPFPKTLSDIVDVSNVQFRKAEIGSFGIIPELRYYPGKKGALRGFYVGPFVNYSHYKTGLPIEYNSKLGIFNGKLSTITGGLQIGVQSKLSKAIYLDIWILGPNYGGSSGNLLFSGSLTPDEETALRDNLENIKEEFDLHFIKSYQVNSQGGTIDVRGPWAGVRGAGINLGVRF